MILRAKAVFPITAPPIEDGAVFIVGQKIRAVAPWKDLRPRFRERALDLGPVVVLPGFVNAHCHLDYTDMAGELAPPKLFTDWIAAILAAKTAWGYSDYARSWLRGAHQLLKSGVTTVGDIEAMPDLLPEVWDATPLRVFSFLEMTGIRFRRNPADILREAVETMESLHHARNHLGLSPHAPYSTLPGLLERTARVARKRNWRVSIHVAESQEEFDMFMNASGPMHEWLRRNGRDPADCGHGSPVVHLARQKLLGENVLAIHANCLARGDATLLAKNQTSVVHCPRSHDYFKHPPFERARLAGAGVNLCLGTDSLATVRKTGKNKPELDMFAELRALANRDKTITPSEILEMATVNGARALGLRGKIGELAPGAFADLIAIPFSGKISNIPNVVLQHTGSVSASLIEPLGRSANLTRGVERTTNPGAKGFDTNFTNSREFLGEHLAVGRFPELTAPGTRASAWNAAASAPLSDGRKRRFASACRAKRGGVIWRCGNVESSARNTKRGREGAGKQVQPQLHLP